MNSPDLTSWINHEPRSSAQSRAFHSPFDGQTIGIVHEASLIDFVQALAPAKKALEVAEKQTPAERGELLRRIADGISTKARALAAQVALFEGWSESFARDRIVEPTEKYFRHVAEQVSRATELPHATGLISIIAPAPTAFRFIGERLAPALAAGNSVLVKSPSGSPVTARLWGELLRDANVPPGQVALLVGSSRELGPMFAEHPSLRAVSFGGRAATAPAILRAGAESMKKMQVAAGTKNSLLVTPDADFARFPQWMEAAFAGQGRLAWNLTQILVTENRTEELLARLTEFLGSLEPLRSPAGSSVWTPLADARDRESLRRAREQVGADRGHMLSTGGDEGPYHVRPLVIRDLTHCSTLQLEELNAPVVIVNTVKYVHEMAKWVNTGDFGLCASVEGSVEKAERLATKLHVGQTWINSWWDRAEPVTGWRKSFFGMPDFRWNGNFYADVKTLT